MLQRSNDSFHRRCSLLARAVCLLVLIWSIPAPADESEDLPVEAVPEPPTIQEQIRKSDLIVRAVLLRHRSYTLAGKPMHQARFRVVASLRASSFFPLKAGDEFTVQYTIRPDVIGPHFMEAPDTGEYIVLLQLKNVMADGRIAGQVVRFVWPEPFALYDPSPEILKEAGKKR